MRLDDERFLGRGGIRWLSPPAGWLAGAEAALSLRHGGVSQAPYDSLNLGHSAGDSLDLVAENEALLRRALALPDPPARARLEHGKRWIVVSAAGVYGPYDALLTRAPRLALWLTVADCLPVYFAAGEWIALLHAGWRGVAGGAVEEVVRTLAGLSGVGPDGQRVWIGPGIGPCCYEVGPEVAERFPRDTHQSVGGSRRLDLPAAALRELTGAGVPASAVARSGLCTSCRSDLFFSYRRDGARSGRMAAVLWKNGA